MKKKLLFMCMAAAFIYFTASCEKDDGLEVQPELSVSDSTLTLAAEANNVDTFVVSSNTDWTVESSEDWLTADPISGTNDDSVFVTAQENSDPLERTATLTVSTDGGPSITIQVTQSGTGFSIAVSREAVTLELEANSSDTFRIISNTSWTIENPEAWLTVEPTSGDNDGVITVTTAEKTTISTPRTVTLTISGEEAAPREVDVTQEGIPCEPGDETPCEVAGCTIPEMPTYESLSENPKLPDPFTFLDGSPVETKEDWKCRQAEIAALVQEFELGYKPCTPKDAVSASFAENTITVTVADDNGKEISFDCPVIYPTSGTAPYPAMIGIGFSSLDNDLLSELGVAIVIFPTDELAQQSGGGSRGKGKFYDFFCSDFSAGALMGWSWGVSRLIDAIEMTPEANINPERLGVTGCSRWGKGALIAGAFDDRIALTIPQESGSGGAASWRVSDWQQSEGDNVQTLSQIVGENVWLRQNFSQFSSTAEKLPFDHHSVFGLVAPRGLLVIENTSMEWLGNISTWTTANAAHRIWEALGVPENMGFSQVGHGSHCSYPEVQKPELEAYVKKFLLDDDSGETNIMTTDGDFEFGAEEEERWIDWETPVLE